MAPVVTIIAAYGNGSLTAAVTRQLLEQGQSDVVVIDNEGRCHLPGHPRLSIFRPGENLGWLRASNLGATLALHESAYDVLVFLNNDTILCSDFIEGLLAGFDVAGAGIVAPMYDDVFPQQILEGVPDATTWTAPRPRLPHVIVPFVDGTAFAIHADLWTELGPLDADVFAEYGWGGDFDMCLRVRAAGFCCVVSSAAYINHLHQATATLVARERGIDWNTEAGRALEAGMRRKYGPGWRFQLHVLGSHIARRQLDPCGIPT